MNKTISNLVTLEDNAQTKFIRKARLAALETIVNLALKGPPLPIIDMKAIEQNKIEIEGWLDTMQVSNIFISDTAPDELASLLHNADRIFNWILNQNSND